MKKEPERLEMDLQKIFLTPPNTMKEKVTLILMMVVVFVMFFGPVVFTEISPVKGVLLSALPALSISWGYMVLLRSLFRKREFSKDPEPGKKKGEKRNECQYHCKKTQMISRPPSGPEGAQQNYTSIRKTRSTGKAIFNAASAALPWKQTVLTSRLCRG